MNMPTTVPKLMTLDDSSDDISIQAIAEIQRQRDAGKLTAREALHCIIAIVEDYERSRGKL